MNRSIKKIWNLYRIFCLCCFAFTSKGQSMEALLKIAEDNNLELKTLEQNYFSELEKAGQVTDLPDPEVGIGWFALPVETRLGSQILRVGATQMFPQKGILKAKEAAILAKAKAQYERIAATQLNLNFQIKQAYFQAYEIEKSQAIVQRNIRIFEAMERLTLTKVESGKGSAADVLRVQLKIRELQQELAILENKKKKPLAALNQLLNRPLNTTVTIADSLELADISYSVDSLQVNIWDRHPMIQMFALQQEAASKSLIVNDLSSMPTFGVGLDYIWVNKIPNTEFKNNGRDVIMPKASVKIPLYKNKYNARQREKELKIAALETQKEDLKNRFLAKIDQALTDYQEVLLQLDLYREQIRMTKGIARVLQTQYSTEGKGFDELLQIQTDLVKYDLWILKAIVRSHLAKAEIERYLN